MNKWNIGDWEDYSPGVEYSPSTKLYWANGKGYDELSAYHNGIIGLGAQLKEIIKKENESS